MPVHSLIFISLTGNVVYSKYFLDTSGDHDSKLLFEQRLFKQTAPNWNRIGTNPSTITITDIHVVYQSIGDMIVFASGTDDVDESIRKFKIALNCRTKLTIPTQSFKFYYVTKWWRS
jgi:hypothetical protein